MQNTDDERGANGTAAPLRIGLTGGIASGKSLVADAFCELGAVLIDTDQVAREVVEPGQPALAELARLFGRHLLSADGSLDRKALRQIVFADDAARAQLEALLHPLIQAETRRQADAAHRHGKGLYQIIAVPLLTESALQDFMDRILVVDIDAATQLERLLKRDGESEQQARRIIQAQASRDERLAIADDVIDNSGSITETRQQVAALHAVYVALALQKASQAG